MIRTSDSNTLKIISSTVQELSLARDIDTVTRIVRTVARKLTGADGATFVLRDGNLCFYADEDAISPLWKGSRFPMSSCISGWAMLHKKSVIIENIYKDDRIPHAAYKPTFVKSLAMVPIRTMAPIGAIGNYWASYHLPTTAEIELLQCLADITAVTIENVYVYQELEQRVKNRTAELEATNKELEAFSYSVSHDLRAPLRSIIGYSDILKEEDVDKLSEPGRKALNVVQQNAGKMTTLIEDLLHFSSMGKKDVQRDLVDSERLVTQVIEELREATTNVETKVGHLPSVEGDENLLKQVWINFISNAIKYSSKKAFPVVEIGSYHVDNEVVFVIKDNGAGFDMKYADKLFNPFQRLHKSNEFPGSGVGLALAHRIITRHGGRVWVESKVNEGATFYFCLPASKS